MAKQSLNTIKNWFKTRLKPTQAQFWDTWDSFWHKDDSIPTESVTGLDTILNSKASTESVTNLQNSVSQSITDIGNEIILLADSVAGAEDQILANQAMDDLTYSFELNEPLTKGQIVQLLESGKIEGVKLSSTVDRAAGAGTTFEPDSSNYMRVAFDPGTPGSFVIAYTGENNVGTCIAGTFDGTNVVFGTRKIFLASTVYVPVVAFDPHAPGKFAIAYPNNNNSKRLEVAIGTVAANEITLGAAQLSTRYVSNLSIAYDPFNADTFLISYTDQGTYAGKCIVCTTTGNDVAFGSPVEFTPFISYKTVVLFDPNTAGSVIVAYNRSGYAGEVIPGTLNAGVLTFGAPSAFSDAYINTMDASFDPLIPGRFIVAWEDGAIGLVAAGTTDQNAVTLGAPVEFLSTQPYNVSLSFDYFTQGQFVLGYMDNAINQNAFVISGSCQGVELSLSATRAIVTTAAQNLILKFDPSRAGAYIAVYRDGFPGKVVSEQLSFTSNLNQDDLVGILQESGLATEIKPVRLLGGVDDNQQGLVIGETFYVQADGSLGKNAAAPAVLLGRAVSETAILMDMGDALAPKLDRGNYAGTGEDLYNAIQNILDLLASDDTTLDELQEIVNFIKQNKSELDSLGIANIAGLTDALAAKVDKVAGKQLSTEDFTTTLKQKLDGIDMNSKLDRGTYTGTAQDLYELTQNNYNGVVLPTSGVTAMTKVGNTDLNWLLKDVKLVLLADNLTENAVIADYANPEIIAGADLTGASGQVMVKIPRFYYREELDGSGVLVRADISPIKLIGFTCHPKFTRPDGTEREFVYVGAFEASRDASSMLASASDAAVWTPQTLATYRANAFSRGAGWYPYDFWTHHLVQALFYAYYGTFDSQTALPGYTERTAWNDTYKRNTGRSSILTGINGTVPADLAGLDADLDDANWRIAEKNIANRFLFIENIFGHVWKFLDGCSFDGRVGQPNLAYVTNNPALFSSVDADILANYEVLGGELPAASNEAYVQSLQAGFLPKAHGGGSTTYVTDYFWSYLDDETRDYFRSVRSGGNLYFGGQAGVAARISLDSLGNAASTIGSRLCAAP